MSHSPNRPVFIIPHTFAFAQEPISFPFLNLTFFPNLCNIFVLYYCFAQGNSCTPACNLL
nr:MAG TPA: hypothetical protein [Caudoviricetes sp.]